MVATVIVVVGISVAVVSLIVGNETSSQILYRLGWAILVLGLFTFATMDEDINSFVANNCLFFHCMVLTFTALSAFYAYTGKPFMVVPVLYLLCVIFFQRWIRTHNEEAQNSCWPRPTTVVATWTVLHWGIGFGASDLYLILHDNVQLSTDTSISLLCLPMLP